MFLDAYAASEDKATVKDMILARKHIHDDLERMSVDQLREEVRRLRAAQGEAGIPPIPFCAFEGNRPIWERFVVLVWVRARKDNDKITLEEVSARIPATDPVAINALSNELLYFFTQLSRDDIERMTAVAVEDSESEEKKVSGGNPTD